MATPTYEDYFELSQAVSQLKPVSTFLKETFFKSEFTTPYETVAFEIESATDGLAHVVLKDAPARAVAKDTKIAKHYNLIRTKEKINFSVKEFEELRRLGSATNQDRLSEYDQYVLKHMQKLRDRAARREEQFCASALSTGKITITEDDVLYEIDFGYTSNQSKTLSATAKWNASTGDPHETIIEYQRTIAERTGLKADIVIMGKQAATDFRSNPIALSKLDNLNYRVGQVAPFAASGLGVGGILIGVLPDGTQLYEYNQVYTNYSGASTAMFNTNQIIVTSSSAAMYMEYVYGTIHRFDPNNTTNFNIQSTPKMRADIYKNQDGSNGIFQLETIGLPIIKSPDPIIVATVHV